MGQLNSQAQRIKFEAENGTFAGGLKIEKSYPGYSGSGYVGRFENTTDILTIGFTLEQASNYNINIGYISPFGDKINFITVNGNKAEISFPSANSFREVFAGKIRLKSGSNEIVVSKSWGWFYIDYLQIEKSTDPDTEFNISDQLVSKGATNETKGLYKFLIDNFRKKIISGVMTLDSFDESNWLKQNTGKEPALLGIDFMHTNRGYSWYNNLIPVNDAQTWYSRNGIPAMMWHWRDPSRKTEEFYTNKTTFDISKITDSGSDEYKAMLSDIDFTAGLLKKLQDQKVPVIWRPLHEASGGWFWWGAKGPEPAKMLWRLMFDRMVNYHGLKNLIWVWTTDASANNLTWYPGDEYVDILGVDIYAENGDFGSQVLQFNKIKDDFKGKKMVTLSENGIIPAVNNLITDQAYWSWFMVWYGFFVRDGIKNPLTNWQSVLNHEFVITLDEMPVLSQYLGIEPVKRKPEDENFQIYVNRENQLLNIQIRDFLPLHEFSIYDLNGKLILRKILKNNDSNFSISGFSSGIYIALLKSEKKVKTLKIIL